MSAQSLYTEWLTFLASERRASPRTVRAYGDDVERWLDFLMRHLGTLPDDAALKAMKANGTWMIPTLMALEGVRARLGKGVYTPTVEVKARQALEVAGRQVTRSKAMGVKIAFGTDAGVFEHGRNGQEFALLVKAGLTNREALASATTSAAQVLDMENEIGRIAPGYSADLIAVSGNPLADVRVLEKVDWVMARGRVAP